VPLSSYIDDRQVRAFRYGKAMEALGGIVKKPRLCALHSLRIEGSSAIGLVSLVGRTMEVRRVQVKKASSMDDSQGVSWALED